MATKMTVKQVKKLIGNPADVDKELESFRRAANMLSSKNPRMIDQYEKKWVAVYRGKVRAHARSLNALVAKIDQNNLPRHHLIVRLIQKDRRTMIL